MEERNFYKMKRIIVLSLAGVLLGLTSCEKQELVEPQPKEWSGELPYHGLPPGYWESNPRVD